MRTFKSDNVIFHYNSDFSGHIIINNQNNEKEPPVKIPAKSVLSFVANYIRDEKINKLEEMSDKDLLGI